jgi:hypothetical protein
MLTADQILSQTLRGTTEYRHRTNTRRNKVLYIEETWALQWAAGSRYGCGYGTTYVSGCIRLVLIPEELTTIGGFDIWDTGRDAQGPATKKKLARIIEVCAEEVGANRDGAARRVRNLLREEFPYKKDSK